MNIENAALAYQINYLGSTLKVYHADKGQGIPRHEHEYPHLTMCHSGACVVRKEGRHLVITKNSAPVNLVPREWHEIEAIEDGTVFVNMFAEGHS